MLVLIDLWLLNLTFSMTKAMNNENSSKKNFHPPLFSPLNALGKTLLQLLFVFHFTPSLFPFKLYKFLLTPLQLRLHSLRANQI